MSDTTLTDDEARAIARDWQSPGNIGHVMATLASGRPVGREALWLDVDTTLHSDNPQGAERDRLCKLQEWADNAESDLLTDDDDN